MQNTWEQLPKTVVDPTTIEEAIDSAIATHAEDAEAHMATGQAIENHRENEVIDHPAESVVNDKLAINSRYFNAIVDPDDDESFDTIQGAIDYCEANNYGNIYITSGTHYVDANLNIDPRISLYGDGINETIILPDTNGAYELQIVKHASSGDEYEYLCNIQNLTFGSPSLRFFADQLDLDISARLVNVNFAGFTNAWIWGLFGGVGSLVFDGCIFSCDGSWPAIRNYGAKYLNCTFNSTSNSFPGISLMAGILEDCTLYGSGSGTAITWFDSFDHYAHIRNSRITECANTFANGDLLNPPEQLIISQNYIEMSASSRLDINADNTLFTGNKVVHASGNTVRVMSGTLRCVVLGNITSQAITDSGTGSAVTANVLI